jgi:hypothetical protein
MIGRRRNRDMWSAYRVPPLATVIGTILEIMGLPTLNAGLWGGAAGAWMWVRGRDDKIEEAAKSAAPPVLSSASARR